MLCGYGSHDALKCYYEYSHSSWIPYKPVYDAPRTLLSSPLIETDNGTATVIHDNCNSYNDDVIATFIELSLNDSCIKIYPVGMSKTTIVLPLTKIHTIEYNKCKLQLVMKDRIHETITIAIIVNTVPSEVSQMLATVTTQFHNWNRNRYVSTAHMDIQQEKVAS